MKFLRIFFTVILVMILIVPMSAYPYVRAFNSMIDSKERLTDAVVDSGINKEIKDLVNETINAYLDELEKEVTKSVKDSIKKSTNGKVNADLIMNTKEVKDTIKKVKEEVDNTLKKFNTEDNINDILAKTIEVLHDDEEVDINKIIKEEIDAIIKKTGISIESETKELLYKFADELSKSIYEEIKESDSSELSLNEENNAIINPIPSYIELAKKYENYVLIGIIVLMIIILLINIKKVLTGVRSIAIGLLISGIFVVLSSTAYKLVDMDSILGESSITNLVIKLLESIINMVNTTGIIYIVVGIIGIIGTIIISKIKKAKAK